MNNNFISKIFDEVLRIVFWDYHQKEISEYNNLRDEEKHEFSPEFEAKMRIILNQISKGS
ncbi:MAG: hypothetical protein FWD71_14640 [Oscillospiraceae bacterium]|nr:hypothetical protein [Oscillospiraceae bacterium]